MLTLEEDINEDHEVECILSHLPNVKSLGCDGITNEFSKEFVEHLVILFQEVWSSDEIPILGILVSSSFYQKLPRFCL